MKPLVEDVLDPKAGETPDIADLREQPAGLARYFSRNAPWLNSWRRKRADRRQQDNLADSTRIDSQADPD